MGKKLRREEEEELQLTEDERRALRGSKFAPLPSQPSISRSHPRLAHPGGPLTTNKAAALAKFLDRKLKEPGGLSSINPDLVELAVKNAKDTLKAAGGTSSSGTIVRHVDSFGDSIEDSDEDKEDVHNQVEGTKQKKHKKHKKKKRKKAVESTETTNTTKHRKKSKS
ncbi:uncharacterized protein LOC131231318 [Magnolia sinica]|uniref:uncharacterized protein LOC131231318 n=1 Tax=Magnolia sinica TaxID=86752 RepID=UPI00265A8226|nr:uncharacterized protein LOC131231318 [Magnolia sinica]